MVFELHIWGPAFGLPSIDAQCIAAIAYLQQVVPRGEWTLIASSNPALSPTNQLPALRNGDIWIGGFRNIFHYIAQYSSGEWVLDAGLPELDGADCIAFSSFLEAHGQPLLDLSLYVSSSNYTGVTRPQFSKLQSFPLPYLTPTSLRNAAKERTEHLNLSSLDIDIDAEPSPSTPSIIPASLRNPRHTVSSFLAASPEAGAQIRLDALATAFFEPLNELRGDKRYFISRKHFSSLDCLAIGYLSLMLIPELPQPWLSKTMRTKFPDLCAWTETLVSSVFGPETTLADAFLKPRLEGEEKVKSLLPWQPSCSGGVVGIGSAFLGSLVDSLPIVKPLRQTRHLRQPGTETKIEKQASWQTVTFVASLIAGAGLVVAYAVKQGLLPLDSGAEKKSSLGDLGDVGEALGMYSRQMDAQVQLEKDVEDRERAIMEGSEARVPVAEVGIVD